MQKLLDQGLNSSHSSDNAKSLTASLPGNSLIPLLMKEEFLAKKEKCDAKWREISKPKEEKRKEYKILQKTWKTSA